jgi:hypothetical protein
MAYIVSRRSHNSRGFYLVESYRNGQGSPRLRTLCYLGREQDGTDSIDKAIAHWQAVLERCQAELPAAKGEKAAVLRRRRKSVSAKLALLRVHLGAAEAKRSREQEERERMRQQAEEAEHWLAFNRLRLEPSEVNARAARQAFLALAKRHHPDQGGDHESFLWVKQAYDRVKSFWESRRIG